jgi:hypothetical protein
MPVSSSEAQLIVELQVIEPMSSVFGGTRNDVVVQLPARNVVTNARTVAPLGLVETNPITRQVPDPTQETDTAPIVGSVCRGVGGESAVHVEPSSS